MDAMSAAIYWAKETRERVRQEMKPILTILEPEHFSEAALARLREHFTFGLAIHSGVNGRIAVSEESGIVWVRLLRFDIARCPKLRAIATNCTGTDHIDLEECQRRGIEVLSLKGIEGLDNVHATAEHTISLMLQALRHRCDRSSGRSGRELRGKQVCIVGCGRIGQQVADMTDTLTGRPAYVWPDDNVPANNEDVLSYSDIVSIHASLNETSKGMVNAEFLSKLKPGAIVVNTARDAIVDTEAMLTWLRDNPGSVYAHDFKQEFRIGALNSDHQLWSVAEEQVIGTEHIGGWTIESLHKTEELLAEKVIEWAKIRETGFCEVAPVNGCRAWKDSSGRTYVEGP